MQAKKILSNIFYIAFILMMSGLMFLLGHISLASIAVIVGVAVILLIISIIIRFSYLTEINDRIKTIRISIWVLFVFYSTILLIFLFFSGRRTATDTSYITYFRTNTNFVPFKEIIEHYKSFAHINFSYVFRMILGNFIAFTPMAFFVPILFKKIKNFIRFTFLMLSLIIAVEVLQFITMRGSLDIDDIILNFSGAIIAYIIIKIKIFRYIFKRLCITL